MRDWQGSLQARFTARAGTTVMEELHHSGPLLVQSLFYPQTEKEQVQTAHCLVLHPPGALASGDSLHEHFSVHDGARVLITSPAAQKFYRCHPPLEQHQRVSCEIEHGFLAYLHQENIFYREAQARLDLDIKLTAGAFVSAEISCLGRFGLGEVFDKGSLISHTRIARGKDLICEEHLRLDEEIFSVKQPGLLHGLPCLLTIYASAAPAPASGAGAGASASDEALANLARSEDLAVYEPNFMAAATFRGGLFCARALSSSILPIKRYELYVLSLLFPLLAGRPFVLPRIWAT